MNQSSDTPLERPMPSADTACPAELVETPTSTNPSTRPVAAEARKLRREELRWWIKLVVQPSLVLICGAIVIIALGLTQKLGFIESGSLVAAGGESASDVTYICPMMCTAPQSEPGRCPVCAMELVPATSSGSGEASTSIEIEPAARRIANIQTVQVRSEPSSRPIMAVGEIAYDETRLKSIAAYVDGRIERLYVDYTGATVDAGDHLALVYSPELYTSQVEFLLAFESSKLRGESDIHRVRNSSAQIYESSKQRLTEFGMTAEQIENLESTGEAQSRLQICAPMGGTVIQKAVVDGQYVTEGQTLFQLADLSTVWLLLELFPEDVMSICYGQRVEAEVHSMPGQRFVGRVAFIDPDVDPVTRTVSVRVMMPNDDGKLRIGDFARATISVPISPHDSELHRIYDAELAGKWICPKHPHHLATESGSCSLCETELVATSSLGFSESNDDSYSTILVPRDAVLMTGRNSVIYVESEPGRFELRQVVLGPSIGDDIAILDGITASERVATRGNFLIDSQMQLAGNPSLIDPTKALPPDPMDLMAPLPPEVIAALDELEPSERKSAEEQRICPVTEMLLGSMGTPPKIEVEGREVFLCCIGCEDRMRKDPAQYFAILDQSRIPKANRDPKVIAALAELSDEDRILAEAQVECPVADMPLGSMGIPIKVDVDGTPIFICCEGCRKRLLAEPLEYIEKAKSYSDRVASLPDDGDDFAPPIGSIQVVGEKDGLPSIGTIEMIPSDKSSDINLAPPIPGTIEIVAPQQETPRQDNKGEDQ